MLRDFATLGKALLTMTTAVAYGLCTTLPDSLRGLACRSPQERFSQNQPASSEIKINPADFLKKLTTVPEFRRAAFIGLCAFGGIGYTSSTIHHTSIATQVLGGIVLGGLAISGFETIAHGLFLHMGKEGIKFCGQYPTLHNLLVGVAEHAFGHHVLYHPGSYTKPDPTKLNNVLETMRSYNVPREIYEPEEIGLGLTWSGFLRYLFPATPYILLPFLLGAPTSFSVPYALQFLRGPLSARYIHRWLHTDFEKAKKEGPWHIRLLFRLPLGKLLWRHHFIHHKNAKVNQNIVVFNYLLASLSLFFVKNCVLGGDLALGLYRSPDTAIRDKIAKAGGPK